MYISDYFSRIDQVISGCPAIISKELLFDQRTKRKNIPSHHKHVSDEENIIPASIPDLQDVLKEVIMYLL